MSKVTFDYAKASSFISAEEVSYMEKLTKDAKELLLARTGAGNDFLGWIDLPVDYDKEEFARIQKAAAKIQSDSEVLVVIGIGGSYLGARAAIECLRHGFYNNLPKEVRKTPEIYYAGNSISGAYLEGLLDVVGDRDFSVNVISKSGTTTEPAIAFRVFKDKLEKKYGKEGSSIIIDNCQDILFGGFAPNSESAEILSKALGNRTVLGGSVSSGTHDPSQSLQMMGRPLMSPDELKTLPKGNFILAKTGCCPMRTQLPLFLRWGIHFEEPYEMPEKAARPVFYADRFELEEEIMLRNGFWEDEEEEDVDEECEEDSFWEERRKSPLRTD